MAKRVLGVYGETGGEATRETVLQGTALVTGYVKGLVGKDIAKGLKALGRGAKTLSAKAKASAEARAKAQSATSDETHKA